jgi:succinate dehydrogenase/fumarate reductase flavoprotein subunit
MCAALGNVEEDYPEWHAFDTVKGGDYLVDQPAALLMTEEAVDAVYQLEHWGLPFNRTPDGRIGQRRFGGHTRNHGEAAVRRACYAADRTGHMILQTLYQQCVKRDVRFFNEFYCLDLLFDDDRVAGVVAYELARVYLQVEPTREPVPIQPTAHYAMGGIPTNVEGQVVTGPEESPVPGLYAAGECACVSVHGANRLGTNSLLDIVVFGRRGGAHMAEHARDAGTPGLPDDAIGPTLEMLDGFLTRERRESPADIRRELQDTLFDEAFVVRTEESLARAEETLADLRDRYETLGVQDKGSIYNTDLMETVELRFLLDCADTLVAAARDRTETRGGHYREDSATRPIG